MKILNIVFVFILAGNLFAQSDCACCDPVHAQFDFWVGEWTVTNVNGNQVGENSISKMDGNCMLMERWKGGSGVTGTSMNYFDKTDSTWNQLWVDNQGTILKLKGELISGKMVLKSDLARGPQGGTYYNQITWTPNEDGTVTQLWEIFNQEEELIQTLFKGIYRRKN